MTRIGIIDRGEQVQVSDRRLAPAERPGGLDAPHAPHVPQPREEIGDERIGVMDEQARARSSDPRDALQDVLLGPLREPLHVAEAAGLGGRAQPVQRVDPERLVKQTDRPWADAGDAEHLEHAIGDLGAQPLVVLEPAGLGKLGQLRGQRLAGAGNLGRLTALEERRDVVGVALDRIGHPTVGDRLVDDLAEDLEHVADLVEDPRQLRVADHRVAAARHAPWPRHRAILGVRTTGGPHADGGPGGMPRMAPISRVSRELPRRWSEWTTRKRPCHAAAA